MLNRQQFKQKKCFQNNMYSWSLYVTVTLTVCDKYSWGMFHRYPCMSLNNVHSKNFYVWIFLGNIHEKYTIQIFAVKIWYKYSVPKNFGSSFHSSCWNKSHWICYCLILVPNIPEESTIMIHVLWANIIVYH